MENLTSALVKAKAKEFGADLVGIAAGRVLDAHPPDPKHAQTPSLVSRRDNNTVIVMAKRCLARTAVLTSAELEPDKRLTKPLCLGEECGRCLMACPGDAILQWGLDKKKCAPYASPYGFSHVVAHVGNVLRAESADEQIALLRSG